MKELSIEEKAKRYDKAKSIMEKYLESGNAGVIAENTIKKAFPEIAESEDERIRKWLIHYFKEVCDNVSEKEKKGVLAWLEKQGKKDEEILILKDQIESLHAAIKAIKETHRIELEKQGEQKSFDDLTQQEAMDIAVAKCFEQGGQKPTDKIEPKFKVGDFIQFNGMGHTRYTVKEVCGLSHYINTCNKRMDMSYTDANFELVEQKPASWSEEDESRMDNLCHFLEEYGNQYYGHLTLQGTISWLKSLRPQSHWKPTDEQMNILWDAIVYIEGCNSNFKDSGSVLENLYNDLKKLKG